MLNLYDNKWTLFLDRDGVINKEIKGTYVTQWSEFKFFDGSLDALAILNQIFGRIIIVTNQRGVGRGIMSIDALKEIHANMLTEINIKGGRINKIYACTSIHDEDSNRKPNIGMALQAKEDFPEIDFNKSIMVGNNLSDMIFGRKLSMKTIFLHTTSKAVDLPHELIDQQYPSLNTWVENLKIPKLSTSF